MNFDYLSMFLKKYNDKYVLKSEEYDAISYILLYYFFPTSDYIVEMEKAGNLSWYLPWTMRGIKYIRNYHGEYIANIKNELL